LVAGTLAGQWVLVLMGFVPLALLAMSYHGLLRATLALERRLLQVEIQRPEEERNAVLRVGLPARLKARVTNRSGATLRALRLEPHAASALRVQAGLDGVLDLPARSEVELELSVAAHASGRWVFHGFKAQLEDPLGLVGVGEYVPATFPLKFLPDLAWAKKSAARLLQQRGQERDGLHLVRHLGSGTELRELRDHQPGDPFRAIAWKATARTGRLMVREYESEFVRNLYLCLDISSTMRGGHAPNRTSAKLEHATHLLLGVAEQATSASDRVGLITFDERVWGHLRPHEGRAHLGQLLQHLLAARHVVDEDLTEYSEQEVAELLARYLMVQERLDFRKRVVRRSVKGVGQGLDYWSFSRELQEIDRTIYDLDLLDQWLRAALPEEEARLGDPCLDTGVTRYHELSDVRRFCHLRGLELPYRVEARLGQKERGLIQALEMILAEGRDSHTIMIFSDLSGIVNTEAVARCLKHVRARRHQLVFVSPFTPAYVPAQDAPERAMLHELFALADQEDRAQTVRTIQAQGIPVLTVGPEDTLAHLQRRLR
jgi:uncharacterized protein (DUF58 family)